MATDLFSTGWKDDALDWGLIVLSAPIWLPLFFINSFQLRVKTCPLVRGQVDVAWERCSTVWRDVGLVCQDTPSHYSVPFAHLLAVALAQQHRSQREFFLGKLLDPDPLLAAYAFKCLVRVCDLGPQDVPAEALSRSDLIRVLDGQYVDEQRLGDFFKVYFVQKEQGQAIANGWKANWWRRLRW